MLIGFFCAIITCIFYALIPSVAKLYYMSGGETISLLLLRSVFQTALAPVAITALRQSFKLPQLVRRLAVGYAIIYAIDYFLYYESLTLIPVALVIMLYFTYPAIVMILEGVFSGQRIGLHHIIGFVVIYSCIIIFMSPYYDIANTASLSVYGIGLGVGSAILMAVQIFMLKRAVAHVSPPTFYFYINAMMALIFIVVTLLTQPDFGQLWLAFAVAGLSITGDICLGYSLKMLGNIKASLILSLEPIFAISFTVLILSDHLTQTQLLAAMGICLAIYYTTLRQKHR